ncbi:hypothetical protein [Streptomyces gobiensis]|uniref:hypothetical protein n=1 Tax=Streptomyces gobiensis TaxID=2875706 RepID=UPI001E2DC1D9|nr:hypothetical protein [Streptomyces gobiensis]UGY91472.1 hypothetical protein test1122_06895 [Streptomyces gobiensis]
MHRTTTPRTTAHLTMPARATAALAGVAAFALFSAACGESGEGAAVRTDTAPASATAALPYVLNHHGEQNRVKGALQRSPKDLVLSEFTTVNDVDWQRWDADRAVGTGKVTGTWCLDTCLDKPLKATVTLSDPQAASEKADETDDRTDDRKVFASFEVKLTEDSGMYDSEDLRGKRALTAP